MTNGYQYPYFPPPAPAPASAPSDKKGKKGKARKPRTSLKRRREAGNPNTNLPLTSLTSPSKLHFYCHFHGWVTGWSSGQGGDHGDPCQFMKSRPSVHPFHASCPRSRFCPQPPWLQHVQGANESTSPIVFLASHILSTSIHHLPPPPRPPTASRIETT